MERNIVERTRLERSRLSHSRLGLAKARTRTYIHARARASDPRFLNEFNGLAAPPSSHWFIICASVKQSPPPL